MQQGDNVTPIKRSFIIELSDGTKLDWYSLSREQRRMMKRKMPPALLAKIKEGEKG